MKTLLTCCDERDKEVASCCCNEICSRETNTHSNGGEGKVLIVFLLRYEQKKNMDVILML
jgi:hypothetical protein